MTELLEAQSTSGTRDEASPFDVEYFLVEGIGFTCMAYADREGRWRAAFTDVILPGFIRILG